MAIVDGAMGRVSSARQMINVLLGMGGADTVDMVQDLLDNGACVPQRKCSSMD